VAEAGEDAEHLDVALGAHPFEVPVELAEVLPHRQAGLARGFPVAHQPVQHPVFLPADVGILVDGGQVVGDGSVYRILEIQHTRVVHVRDHQVAGMPVAVHVHPGLGQGVGQDGLEGGVKHRPLVGAQGDVQVPGQVPVREQAQFPQQQFPVVVRQFAGPAGELDPDQGGVGIPVEPVGAGLVQGHEIGGVAEIRQQQETFFQVFRVDFRRVGAGRPEQAGDMQIGPAVLMAGRRIHDHETSRLGDGPEIAAKTGVGGGGFQGEKRIGQDGLRPFP
jgi:hypothetical protein